MTPRDRVLSALAHQQPDFVPVDYYATPEIRQALLDHFGVSDDDAIQQCLGTDIRCVNPPYTGPPHETFADGSTRDEWGVRRRPMPNEYGGFILAPCHHIQPDTPLENVLALYQAVARRRGTTLPKT